MHPLQVAALVLLGLGLSIYLWRSVKRRMRADEQFFTLLVERISQILQPKGFQLTRHLYLPKSFGHRIATFEGPAVLLDLMLDGKERDVRLTRRGRDDSNAATEEVLADGYLGFAPTTADYARATGAVLDAAASMPGAA